MRTLRSYIRTVLPVLVLLGMATSAFAAKPILVPYEFTLTPEQCPELETTIMGSGNYLMRINERTDRHGVTYTIINSTTSGIATDTEGNTYRYNYANTQRVVTPAAGSPGELHMTDHFNLIDPSGANRLHVGFVYRITDLTGDGPFTEDDIIGAISERSTLNCDPI